MVDSNYGSTLEVLTTEPFIFNKQKMLGNATYKKTKTTVKLETHQVTVSQTVRRLFRKEANTTIQISCAAIKDLQVHTVMDFWDTLYGIIIAVLGFFQPVLFLLSLACFWCGYGKEIKIITENGVAAKIPFSGSKAQANTLVSQLVTLSDRNTFERKA